MCPSLKPSPDLQDGMSIPLGTRSAHTGQQDQGGTGWCLESLSGCSAYAPSLCCVTCSWGEWRGLPLFHSHPKFHPRNAYNKQTLPGTYRYTQGWRRTRQAHAHRMGASPGPALCTPCFETQATRSYTLSLSFPICKKGTLLLFSSKRRLFHLLKELIFSLYLISYSPFSWFPYVETLFQ